MLCAFAFATAANTPMLTRVTSAVLFLTALLNLFCATGAMPPSLAPTHSAILRRLDHAHARPRRVMAPNPLFGRHRTLPRSPSRPCGYTTNVSATTLPWRGPGANAARAGVSAAFRAGTWGCKRRAAGGPAASKPGTG